MTTINNYFDEKFGYLVLFVFISGIIGDMLIHLGTKIKFPFDKPWFAQGLKPYYKSMEINKSIFSSWILSGIAGGIACVIGLVFGQLLLYAMEDMQKKKQNNS